MPIHLSIAGLTKWLMTQAGLAIFGLLKQKVSENMGLSTKPLTKGDVELLLDHHLHALEDRLSQRIIERMDQERLITLRSGIQQLEMATKIPTMTLMKQSCLGNAISKFSDITSLPRQEHTAGMPNGQLICLAYLGIAAVYIEMGESLTEVAKNIASAIYADATTARLWFGDTLIDRLLTICPKCGRENFQDAMFCQYDGEPLPARDKTTPVRSRKNATQAVAAYCSRGHSIIPPTRYCTTCKTVISASYCRQHHTNPLGATVCSQCGDALAFLI